MPVELDAAAILAGLIFLGILGGSAVLWIARFQRSNVNFVREANVPAWSIGWINFLIFLCAMVISVVAAQVFAGELLHLAGNTSDTAPIEDTSEAIETSIVTDAECIQNKSEPDRPELTPWMAVAAVLLLQIPLLGTFYFLRKFYPEQFAGRFNAHALTLSQALTQALPLFIRYLPIIWIVSFAWSSLLAFLQSRGFIEEFPPQELIKLFTAGGDPTAITLLVILAVVLAPIVEEIVFRGGIYRFLKSQTTLLPAQIISGAVFALMHGNLMSFLPLAVVGILLARVYERSGNILVSICFHACFNGFSLLMLYIMSHTSIPVG
ncbi:MAG: membrane protease YdiL (CAAX protease family) [Lentimonas sp.]|jgi:membrane protease YdiL (CAAX protease family)